MMDNNTWRPAPAGGDWRTQLLPDSRTRIVNKISDTLRRHLAYSGPEGLNEARKIASRFEEKIYTAATSLPDYLRKISVKMLSMESTSHANAANSGGNASSPPPDQGIEMQMQQDQIQQKPIIMTPPPHQLIVQQPNVLMSQQNNMMSYMEQQQQQQPKMMMEQQNNNLQNLQQQQQLAPQDNVISGLHQQQPLMVGTGHYPVQSSSKVPGQQTQQQFQLHPLMQKQLLLQQKQHQQQLLNQMNKGNHVLGEQIREINQRLMDTNICDEEEELRVYLLRSVRNET